MTDLSGEARARVVAARIDQLRELLDANGAGAISLSTRRDFAWLTVGGLNHVVVGSETGVAPVLVTRHEALVIAPVNEYDRIVDEELAGLPLQATSIPWWDDGAPQREMRARAGGDRVMSGQEVAPELERLRTMLDPLEHARMRSLAELVEEALDEVLASLRGGEPEHSVAGQLADHLVAGGARLPVVLVAADERIAKYRHPLPSGKRIERRVMAVVVAERWGLHVAATGTRDLQSPPPELRARQSAVTAVLSRMREATRPGNRLGDVFAAAQAAYADHGMAEEWRQHHQGGTIGYAPRERIAKPDDDTPIRPGMAFAWNPSAAGCKAEETLYLDHDGGRHVLTGSAASTG